MNLQSPANLQRVGILLITLILTFFAFDWGTDQLGYDVFGYYVYFHEYVFNGNLSVESLDYYNALNDQYHMSETLYQFSNTGQGSMISRYPIGWSIFYSPFLLIGHFIAQFTSYPVDGMSLPYEVMVKLGAMVYAFLGLRFLSKIINFYLSELQSLLFVAIIVFGTSYFHIATVTSCMPHLLLFFLYTMLIYYTIKYYQEYQRKHLLIVGLTLGLMVITRPTELIAGLIPLFWGYTSWQEQKQKWLNIDFIYAILVFLAVASIQLIFWKITTGNFLFYSYQSAGEGVDLLSPNLGKFLFSFRKGLFLYSPILLLSILGIVYLFKEKKSYRWAVLLFMLIYTYVVSSWTNWWYAQSFSSRGIFQGLAVFFIPMSLFIFSLKGYKKLLVFTFVFGCIALNQFQIWQMQHGILDGSQMTKEYYFSTFGQTTPVTPAQKDLLLPHHDINRLDANKYELFLEKDIALDTILTKDTPFYTLYNQAFTGLDRDYPMIIECTLNADYVDSAAGLPKTFLTAFIFHKKQKYSYKSRALQPDSTGLKAYMWEANSYVRNENDQIGLEVWVSDGKAVYLSSCNLKIWRRKEAYRH